jgi:hypothetical protein
VLVFLDRPELRAAPTLCTMLSTASSSLGDGHGVHTYLSAEDAIRFAMSEYLHVDCRLMHARQ